MTLLSSAATWILSEDGTVQSHYGRWHSRETLAAWGSVTKVFTAAVASALIIEGTLDPDADVGDLLDLGSCGATVRDLVEHRSGLPRLLPAQEKAPDPYAPYTPERFREEVLDRLPALIGPEREEYSNVGYAVLGCVLEAVAGLPFDALLRSRLGERSGGMSFTTQPRLDGIARARTIGGTPLPDWDVSTGPFVAAGGLYSTLEDVGHALKGALADGPGSPLHPEAPLSAWQHQDRMRWHNGGTLRAGAFVAVRPDKGSVAVAHVVGGLPGMGPTLAQRAVERAVTSLR